MVACELPKLKIRVRFPACAYNLESNRSIGSKSLQLVAEARAYNLESNRSIGSKSLQVTAEAGAYDCRVYYISKIPNRIYPSSIEMI